MEKFRLEITLLHKDRIDKIILEQETNIRLERMQSELLTTNRELNDTKNQVTILTQELIESQSELQKLQLENTENDLSEEDERVLVEVPVSGNTVKAHRQQSFIKNLYVAPSQYASDKDLLLRSIREGLWTKKEVLPGVVIDFDGELIPLDDEQEWKALCDKYGGKPEYLIWVGIQKKSGKALYLDCHKQAMQGKCLASKVNSVRNLKPMDIRVPDPVINCRIRVDTRKHTARLEVTEKISFMRELLTTYGTKFKVDPNEEVREMPVERRSTRKRKTSGSL